MTRIASRIGILALPLALVGCVVAAPYDEPYYAGPPAVVVERPYWRPAYVPRYRVSEEHVYARDRRPRARHERDRHDDHDRHDRHDDHGD